MQDPHLNLILAITLKLLEKISNLKIPSLELPEEAIDKRKKLIEEDVEKFKKSTYFANAVKALALPLDDFFQIITSKELNEEESDNIKLNDETSLTHIANLSDGDILHLFGISSLTKKDLHPSTIWKVLGLKKGPGPPTLRAQRIVKKTIEYLQTSNPNAEFLQFCELVTFTSDFNQEWKYFCHLELGIRYLLNRANLSALRNKSTSIERLLSEFSPKIMRLVNLYRDDNLEEQNKKHYSPQKSFLEKATLNFMLPDFSPTPDFEEIPEFTTLLETLYNFIEQFITPKTTDTFKKLEGSRSPFGLHRSERSFTFQTPPPKNPIAALIEHLTNLIQELIFYYDNYLKIPFEMASKSKYFYGFGQYLQRPENSEELKEIFKLLTNTEYSGSLDVKIHNSKEAIPVDLTVLEVLSPTDDWMLFQYINAFKNPTSKDEDTRFGCEVVIGEYIKNISTNFLKVFPEMKYNPIVFYEKNMVLVMNTLKESMLILILFINEIRDLDKDKITELEERIKEKFPGRYNEAKEQLAKDYTSFSKDNLKDIFLTIISDTVKDVIENFTDNSVIQILLSNLNEPKKLIIHLCSYLRKLDEDLQNLREKIDDIAQRRQQAEIQTPFKHLMKKTQSEGAQ
jgi:hypothetical protein